VEISGDHVVITGAGGGSSLMASGGGVVGQGWDRCRC